MQIFYGMSNAGLVVSAFTLPILRCYFDKWIHRLIFGKIVARSCFGEDNCVSFVIWKGFQTLYDSKSIHCRLPWQLCAWRLLQVQFNLWKLKKGERATLLTAGAIVMSCHKDKFYLTHGKYTHGFYLNDYGPLCFRLKPTHRHSTDTFCLISDSKTNMILISSS